MIKINTDDGKGEINIALSGTIEEVSQNVCTICSVMIMSYIDMLRNGGMPVQQIGNVVGNTTGLIAKNAFEVLNEI